jgi:hypothetical protein
MDVIRGSYIADAGERQVLLHFPDADKPGGSGEITKAQQDFGINALELLVRRAYPTFDITKEMHNKNWVACGYKWLKEKVVVVYRHDFNWYVYEVPRESLRSMVYGVSNKDFDAAIQTLPPL